MGIVTGAVAAYLVGCVPAARIVTRLGGRRRWVPWVAPAADALKGFAAIAMFGPVTTIGQALTVTAVVAGDQWPVFGSEIGRPGLATAGGAMTALTPVAPFIWAVLWAVGFTATGFLTVACAIATALFGPALGWFAGWPLGLIALPSCLMLLERQRAALRRVLRGEEPKHHWRIVS